MSASLINISGSQWAVELLWRTETGRNAKANAKEIAKKFNDDLMCTRALPIANYGASAIQVGLASSRELGTNAKSTPSLAATLASIRKGSWLGAFALPSGNYYALVVKDSAILSNGGDKLFASEEELIQYINGQRKVADWDYIVASGIALDDAETVDLLDILRHRRAKAPQLKVVGGWLKSNGEFPIIRVIQIMLIIGFAVVYFWPGYKPPPVLAVKAKAPPPPPPWPLLRAPSAWIKACGNIIDAAQSAIGGWEFSSLTCNESTAQILMKRTKLGTYGDMLAAGAVLGQDNTNATLSRSMALVAAQGSEPQYDMEIRHRLADAIEVQGDSIDFRLAPPSLPGSDNSQQEPPTWIEIGYQIRTTNKIDTFSWLDAMPGLRVNKIQYLPTEMSTYKIDGIVYVKK